MKRASNQPLLTVLEYLHWDIHTCYNDKGVRVHLANEQSKDFRKRSMQTLDELVKEFFENADRIAEELISGFSLNHNRVVEGLQTPMLRWLDFRLRTIDPYPRQIYLSDRFPKSLDEPISRALQGIEHAILKGDDINPFQGKGLMRSDSSGKNRNERTDLLWADWGIHHLHVAETQTDPTAYFSNRSDFLLFALFGHDAALFIDVQPHSGDPLRFAREDLIQVVARNWPSVLEPFELKRGFIAERQVSDEERKLLRKSGIEAPLLINGKTYFSPGHGVTSASTPGKVTDAIGRLRRNLNALARQVFEPSGQFQTALQEARRHDSHFSLRLLPEGIVVYEQSTDLAWTFPDAKFDGTDSFFGEISNALTPPWVKDAMQEAVRKTQSDAGAE
ncbi:hypothetical protein KNO81_31275 [Paraburkholderia sediminicola]|nr:hypothetical protein [Paraburkholderia sediminicola]